MIPKPPAGSHSDLKLSTSLATLGMYVAVLRERFRDGAVSDPPLPYIWRSKASGETDAATTGLFIESGWNENLEARNVRPGIWVDRDQNVYGRVAIGDQDQIAAVVNVGMESFYCPGDLDIIVDCTSPKRGESMLLGSIVQDFLHMSGRIIMKYFGLRDISPCILNRTVPFEKDIKLWTTPLQFRVAYENRWSTLPAATPIHDLYLRIGDATDPDIYFREIALRSSGVPEDA